MKLFVAGLSFKTAPVDVREKLAVHPSQLRCHGCRLRIGGDLAEVVLLSTCNRVEVYGVTPKVNGNVHRLFQHLSAGEVDFAPHLYIKEGAEAVQHLFSVVSGLDSMVIGETEITGQVKQAYLAAQGAKLTGRITNRLFQTALQAAKEIRTQTGIGRGATSVGSVAVELAERIFDHDLSAKTVMIIGAGKMGEACVRHLAKKGARSVLVSNRSYDRAVSLAAEFGGRAVRFDNCLAAMSEADIVVSSTGSPNTILHRAEVASVMSARRNQPLFLIDIAVPRDIDADVDQLENVFLYNVDHLEAIVRENVRQREQELARCQAILHERTVALMSKLAPAPERNGVARVAGWAIPSAAIRPAQFAGAAA
jgi:glutamyl-tRNA reductase